MAHNSHDPDGDSDEMACDIHQIEELPSGYDRCPMCDEDRRIRAEKMERLARRSDPNMHNMVDAPANAIDHSKPLDFYK